MFPEALPATIQYMQLHIFLLYPLGNFPPIAAIVLLLAFNAISMISFYPGPSRVHNEIPNYVAEAHKKGILSMNHRSEEFMTLCEKTVSLLKEKLSIPKKYTIYFTSSATECWEILAQSLVPNQSLHIYNGAFGEKWFDYTKRLMPDARAHTFSPEEFFPWEEIKVDNSDLICITQNETSNGTQVSQRMISGLQKKNPDTLLAIDATSSMGGIRLDFTKADVWFASVQKCFGLPAGLAILVCSPTVINQIKSKNEKKHYNSLLFIHEMMNTWQTPFTPNVLGIYLLMRVLQDSKRIGLIHRKTITRFEAWKHYFEDNKNLKLYIQNPEVRSYTVLTLTGKPALIAEVKKKAKKKGFLLGEGYGALKETTFRIANFPALKSSEINQLMKFLKKYK